MKQLITFLALAVFSFTLAAQNKSAGTIKFLGIPVDGSKDEMISQLKEKGFSYAPSFDELKGEFNGQDVTLYIRTHHKLVNRVCVVFPSLDKRRIIREYNSLLSQFQANDKYIEILTNTSIPESENIAYEMSVNNKTYASRFSYISPDLFTKEEALEMRKMWAGISKLPSEEMQDAAQALADSLESKLPEVGVEQTLLMIQKVQSVVAGYVWFTIHEDGGQYQLVLYYDNFNNHPHGEDL